MDGNECELQSCDAISHISRSKNMSLAHCSNKIAQFLLLIKDIALTYSNSKVYTLT